MADNLYDDTLEQVAAGRPAPGATREEQVRATADRLDQGSAMRLRLAARQAV